MGLEKSPSSLLLLSILFITSSLVVESRKIEESAKHASHKNENSEMIFFTENDLRIGNKIPIYFQKKSPKKTPRLLPRDEADSIPFSSQDLNETLAFFGFSRASRHAEAMARTLRMCEAEPISGETKVCATSFESMLDFVRAVFGPGRRFTAVKTTFSAGSGPNGLRNYTVMGPVGPEDVWAPKMVACHSMPYPYGVYYCHTQVSESRVYRVPLGDEDGDVAVKAVAVCHVDTSHWNTDHASFRVLGIEPGSSPVCHIFPEDNLVWVPERNNEIKI